MNGEEMYKVWCDGTSIDHDPWIELEGWVKEGWEYLANTAKEENE